MRVAYTAGVLAAMDVHRWHRQPYWLSETWHAGQTGMFALAVDYTLARVPVIWVSCIR